MSDYIWEMLEIERLTKEKLKEELGEAKGDERFGYYSVARGRLIKDLLPEIAKREKDLTDHGPLHVRNVLNNAYKLLGNDISSLNSMELYCLIMSIIFHDVGNFFDRKEHRSKISPIYDRARPLSGGNEEIEEKRVILNICEAHCGQDKDGATINTLKNVTDHTSLEEKIIKPNLLAPILRFADELAEGEQRTSYYMIKKHGYSSESEIYHKYAKSTRIEIDRNTGRVCLTYDINLKLSPDYSDPGIVSLEELESFLTFVYKRATKLNQERQYAKHYCNHLDPFKRTTVTINFSCHEESDLGGYHNRLLYLPIEPIEMSDLIVPGEPTKCFVSYNKAYEPATLKSLVVKAIKSGEEHSHG